MLKVKAKDLIEFYDHKSEDNSQDANSISTLAGEELILSLLCHYFNSQGNQTKIVTRKCKGLGIKGKRLDAWVSKKSRDEEILYQVEIKNWSAHSLGVGPLRIDASPEEVREYKIKRWRQQWEQNKFREGDKIMKVFGDMIRPEGHETFKIKPLLCYWYPIHPSGGTEPFFTQEIKANKFSEVDVFSASAYLRLHIGEEFVLSEMPRTERRLKILENLFRLTTGQDH